MVKQKKLNISGEGVGKREFSETKQTFPTRASLQLEKKTEFLDKFSKTIDIFPNRSEALTPMHYQ